VVPNLLKKPPRQISLQAKTFFSAKTETTKVVCYLNENSSFCQMQLPWAETTFPKRETSKAVSYLRYKLP